MVGASSETVASASAIARRYSLLTGAQARGAKEVLELAAAGDSAAARVWSEAVDALAISIARLIPVIAPEVIVIGGGLSQAGRVLLEPLERAVRNLTVPLPVPAIVQAALGENAGVVGAALLARQA